MEEKKIKLESGFTVIELLVSIAIFAILAAGFLGAFSVLSKTVKAAREKTVLSSLSVNYLEVVKNMPYSQVGTINGNPSGQLADLSNPINVTIESITYRIYYEVTYIDDPADGTATGLPNDPASADYKQVKMNIVNLTTGQLTTFMTNIVPKGLEGTNNAGALSIKVFNFSGQPVAGASIHITSPTTTPTLVLDRQSDGAGNWIEVGLPPLISGYRVTVTAPGYTTDRTYPVSFSNPNPTKPDATVAVGVVTQLSFSIDLLANLTIKTQNEFCQNLSGVNLNVKGGRLIGNTPDVSNYDQNYSSSAGLISLTGIDWDTYTPQLLSGQTWVVRGTSPVQKIDVLPGTSQTFSMILSQAPPDSGDDPDPPWYGDWGYRRKITIDNARVSGSADINNFPVLFSATVNEFRFTGNGGKMGNNNGSDMVFTSADGVTKIPHEIESYTASSGAVLAWVNVPTISPSTDTDIYIYYGKAGAADQQQATGVWDENYKAVYHLPNGTSLSLNESTSNNHDGTNNNATATAGKVDGAANFSSGSSQWVNSNCNANCNFGTGDFTISGWIKTNSNGSRQVFGKYTSGANQYGLSLSNGKSNLNINGTTIAGTSNLNNNTWRYLVGRRTGTATHIFENGVQRASGTSNADVSPGADGSIGRLSASPTNYWNGALDEIRISNISRSDDWIVTEYNNQNSPSTFHLIAAEEPYVPATGINNSVLVIVKDAATQNALENANVHLRKTGASPQDYYGITGGSVWTQDNWAGGSGLADWSNATPDRYFLDDGNVDISILPAGVRLKKIGSAYLPEGWVESATFDTGTDDSDYTTITWAPTSQSAGAHLKFQVASNNDNETWDYTGPDGTSATYYTVSGSNISSINDNNRYVRYKAYLSTTDDANTPVLTSVNINYVSGCFTPGQVFFGELTQGSYDLDVSLGGYTTAVVPGITINGNQSFQVLMNP